MLKSLALLNMLQMKHKYEQKQEDSSAETCYKYIYHHHLLLVDSHHTASLLISINLNILKAVVYHTQYFFSAEITCTYGK